MSATHGMDGSFGFGAHQAMSLRYELQKAPDKQARRQLCFACQRCQGLPRYIPGVGEVRTRHCSMIVMMCTYWCAIGSLMRE